MSNQINSTEVIHNVSMLCHMHEDVMNLGNEDAEEIWFLEYPGADVIEEILEVAKDQQTMEWAKDSHARIMRIYARR